MVDAEYIRTFEEVNRIGNGLREDGVVNEVHQFESPELISEGELAQELKEELKRQKRESYIQNDINWLEGDFWDNWDKIKGHMKKLMNHHEEFDEGEEETKLFFTAHSNDLIKGKPQLVEQVKRRIPLVRLLIKKGVEGKGEDKVEKNIKKVFLFDERSDKRYDGYQKEVLALDFWLYRIIENGNEYYVYSQKELPNDLCELRGMIVPVDDFAELSRSLKLKSISNIFILKEFSPAIKTLDKEQLIQLTTILKNKFSFGVDQFYDNLAHHPLGTFNRFSKEFECARGSITLSGKKDGSPIHLIVWGPAGSKKSMGVLETWQEKIQEEAGIREGGDSNLKSLIPSYKFHPADLGYLAKCLRMGFIDEIGKLIEFEMNKHQGNVKNNILGEINMFLDNKERTIGSGVQNDIKVQSTGKYIFVSNPVSNRKTIYDHVGLIDCTTLSRMINWVQDTDERELIITKGVSKIPPSHSQDSINKDNSPHTFTSIYTYDWNIGINNNKISTLEIVLGGDKSNKGNFNPFLSIFDSCQVFLSEIDENEIQRLVDISTNLAKEPMKSSVWRPRAEHHIHLIVDGLCKIRCLFQDHDSSFTAKQEDYDLAERILVRMVKGWDTNLQPKEDFT